MRQDCNNCATTCRGKELGFLKGTKCPERTLPKGGFTFAELLLTHPQSTNDVLYNLPFKVEMNFYLK